MAVCARVATALDSFGGWEREPTLALAVSGGPDSMALALLCQPWVAAHGGRLVGLIVDHGLRPGSDSEAKGVAAELDRLSIESTILPWVGAKPTRGIQAAARTARHALLEAWCTRHGVLHLAFGHHQDDQAETLIDRLLRGSGVAGLSAIQPIGFRSFGRVVRPLLDLPKQDLIAVAAEAGVAVVDDPSNRDPRFRRTGVRQLLGREGARLAATAIRLQRARTTLARETAALLVRAVSPVPGGWVVDRHALAGSDPELGLAALAALLGQVGRQSVRPRADALERLFHNLQAGPVRATLHGCRLVGDARVVIAAERPRRSRGLEGSGAPSHLPSCENCLVGATVTTDGSALPPQPMIADVWDCRREHTGINSAARAGA